MGGSATFPFSNMIALRSATGGELWRFFRAIASGESVKGIRILERTPRLASECAQVAATREKAREYFLVAIDHYVYAGDTALHIAAAAYETEIAKELIARGANLRARNRRGAEPLHYAADGIPGSSHWNPIAQADVIEILIRAGADPNAKDKSGVAPLHRAVRTRCAAAVRALLANGADPHTKNGSGSTPLHLAIRNTGRGGSGTEPARAQQAEIIRLLAG